jgi:poly-gamma-glutamate synthesis protein (capsule biosynthesis protein)
MYHHKFFWLVIFVLVASLALFSSASAALLRSNQVNNLSFTQLQSPQIFIQDSEAKNYKTRLMFSGDVFWGRRIQTWSEQSELKYAYPFSGLDSFGEIGREAWIANLECPVTSSQVSQPIQENQLKFNCQPEYLTEARKHFDIFGLANNHMDNMQEVGGLNQTRDLLEKQGFQYFGHFDNAVEADICEVISVPVVTEDTATKTTKALPIAMCGYHNVFKLPTPSQIQAISEYSKYFLTISFPHQGKEYISSPDQLQQSVYRSMIDTGADMVIGGHTHSIIAPEVYKDKFILYSTGNFIFDQQATDIVTKGVLVHSEIRFSSAELDRYSDFSQSCIKFKDDCLNQAKAQNLIKPEFKIVYNMYASDNANKLAKRAAPNDEIRILNTVGWPAMKTKMESQSPPQS